MDALKFRRRPLFRQQAVNHFTGIHGQGTMPELLHPGWRRSLRVLQLILVVCTVLWIWAVLSMTSGHDIVSPTPSGATAHDKN